LFNENIAHNAMQTVFDDDLIDLNADYIITTDGDLIVDPGWLDEHIGVLDRHKDVFAIGTDLKTDNLPLNTFPDCKGWIPVVIEEHDDYIEGYCGHHLLAFRMENFVGFLNWRKKKNVAFLDTQIGIYSKELGMTWGRTKFCKSIHWTWTLYQDANHPYTRYKIEYPWIWHNKNKSEYVVYEKLDDAQQD
jgi:hypothetical protein